jgi:transketolase
MGIAAGVGFALAKKLKGEQGRIYVLESDGAMQGGITWEAALIAAHHQLNNLVVFVDSNRLQAMGKTDSILSLFPLEEKWRSFGWDVREINGHNFEAIENAILAPLTEKPLVIICHTVKGRGVPEWEGNNLWHYKAPNEAEYKEALACLT